MNKVSELHANGFFCALVILNLDYLPDRCIHAKKKCLTRLNLYLLIQRLSFVSNSLFRYSVRVRALSLSQILFEPTHEIMVLIT